MILGFGTKCHQHADDIQLSVSLAKSPGDVVEVLSHCPTLVFKWLKGNKLAPNLDKVEMLLVEKVEIWKDTVVLIFVGFG